MPKRKGPPTGIAPTSAMAAQSAATAPLAAGRPIQRSIDTTAVLVATQSRLNQRSVSRALGDLVDAINGRGLDLEDNPTIVHILDRLKRLEARIERLTRLGERAIQDAVVVVSPRSRRCRRALEWLDAHKIAYQVRLIDKEPPGAAELAQWVSASGVPVRDWLNASGPSYRALEKTKVERADDAKIARWIIDDRKLLRRPILIRGELVLVGFTPEMYEEALLGRARRAAGPPRQARGRTKPKS